MTKMRRQWASHHRLLPSISIGLHSEPMPPTWLQGHTHIDISLEPDDIPEKKSLGNRANAITSLSLIDSILYSSGCLVMAFRASGSSSHSKHSSLNRCSIYLSASSRPIGVLFQFVGGQMTGAGWNLLDLLPLLMMNPLSKSKGGISLIHNHSFQF
jgi:hypothetical protein